MSRHLTPLVAALLLVGLAAPLRAEAIRARETAHVREAWSWSTGLFNPLRLALSDDTTLETYPLMNFVGGFNAELQHRALQGDDWVLSVTGGLSSPTLAYRLSQSIDFASPFFPRWKESDLKVGWTLVPSAGVIWSYGGPREGVWTARGDLAVGVPLEPSDAYPVDGLFAPLELLLAPSLTGFRARVGGGYDHPLFDWMRLRTQINLYLTGNHPADRPQLSPLFFEGYAGVDFGIGDHARITLGAKWYNWDQHASQVVIDGDGRAHREFVRSNDFWPTVDFIWAS